MKATIESLLGPLSHDVNHSTAHPPNESVENTRAITFSDLAQRAGISPRLAHSIAHPQFPFKTIGEYLDAGSRRNSSVNMVPHTGHKTIVELAALIDGIFPQLLATQAEKQIKHQKNFGLADELESRYPGVFSPLLQGYRDAPETDCATCLGLERAIQKLIKDNRAAEICRRRFMDETLESIGRNYGLTRERVRQIEARYKDYITNIYSQKYVIGVINRFKPESGMAASLPSNDELALLHPKIFDAIRKVLLPESHRSGALSADERYELAQKLGFNSDAELGQCAKWSIERLIFEVKKVAQLIGKPDLMPMQVEMVKLGRSDLRGAIGRFGGQSAVARLAGLTYQGQIVSEDGSRTYWTNERIGEFLHDVAKKEGHAGVMPTQAECKKHAPNPATITTILTGAGSYKNETAWFELAKRHNLKYSKNTQRVTLSFIRSFVKSLGDALYSLTSSEIYVLFEQQGINKTGKHINMNRRFDNLVTAIQSGYLPRDEVARWTGGKGGELVEALLDTDIDSIDDAFANVGRPLRKVDHKNKADNPQDDDYREDVEQQLPVPRAVDTLSALQTATDLLV